MFPLPFYLVSWASFPVDLHVFLRETWPQLPGQVESAGPADISTGLVRPGVALMEP